MEILWRAKAPRADIYSQFVSALRTTAGCVKRRSRRAGTVCLAAKYALLPAGHAGPALQGAAVAWGGQGRPPLHVLCGTWGTPSPTHLVIASQSAQRSKCPWGTDWRGNPFSPQRKGRIPTPVTRSLARNDSAAALQGPLCEGAVGAADWEREKPWDVSPSVSASRCHLPRRGRLWSSAPLTNRLGWV